jgi:hypothetical protein
MTFSCTTCVSSVQSLICSSLMALPIRGIRDKIRVIRDKKMPRQLTGHSNQNILLIT